MAQWVSRILTRFRPVVSTCTVGAACRVLASGEVFTGVVVDIGLPDGTGWEVIERLRIVQPHVPTLVLTGHLEPEVVHRANHFRAEVSVKPCESLTLAAFAQRAMAHEGVPDGRLLDVVTQFSSRAGLTPRETETLVLSLTVTREELQKCLGISENTLKSLVRGVLQKTGYPSMDILVKTLLLAALKGASAGASVEVRARGGLDGE